MFKTRKMRLVLNRETIRELVGGDLRQLRGGSITQHTVLDCTSGVFTCVACLPGASAGCDPDTNTKKSFCFDCDL